MNIRSHLRPVDYVEIATSRIAGAVLLSAALVAAFLYVLLKITTAQRTNGKWLVASIGVIGIPLVSAVFCGVYGANVAKHAEPSLITLQSSGNSGVSEISGSAARYPSLRGYLLFLLSRQILMRPEGSEGVVSIPNGRIRSIETPSPPSVGHEGPSTAAAAREMKVAMLPKALLPAIPQELQKPPPLFTLMPSPTPTPISAPTPEPTRSPTRKHKRHK